MTALTHGRSREGIAMKAITAAKSAALNLLEGLTLVVLCHALPTFATP